MRVYFVNYHRFEGSSGIHIHFLANALERLGVRCTACVPNAPGKNFTCESPLYNTISFGALKRRALLRPGEFCRHDAVLHAWTPREIVRKCVAGISKRFDIPYCVHLEDNEEQIFEAHTGMGVDQYGHMPWFRKVMLTKAFIHPARYIDFIANAAGVTCIMDSLQEFVPDSVPNLMFWPACESAFFKLSPTLDRDIRRSLNVPESSVVLTYTGNVHAANRDEVQTLYQSVVELNRQGHDVRLLRCGTSHAPMESGLMQDAMPYVTELGSQSPGELIRYIAAANILVQPGKPDKFNDYRFPSKVPMFLASGRPTILPATNIGMYLRHDENCLLLHEGTVEELVGSLKRLIVDPALQQAIGSSGRRFAQEHLSWEKSAKNVLAFYERCLGRVG